MKNWAEWKIGLSENGLSELLSQVKISPSENKMSGKVKSNVKSVWVKHGLSGKLGWVKVWAKRKNWAKWKSVQVKNGLSENLGSVKRSNEKSFWVKNGLSEKLGWVKFQSEWKMKLDSVKIKFELKIGLGEKLSQVKKSE